MLEPTLLVAHIAVLGYWLGSEFVINSGYRYVCRAASMPFEERNKLMNHVLDVDQHVRYALILQLGLGTTLAALYGFIPGGSGAALVAAALAILWLLFVEVIHHKRTDPMGATLARIDRGLRYVVMIGLAAAGLYALVNVTDVPFWLAWKLILFAAVMACGVGIRFSIIDFYRTWAVIKRDGSSDVLEAKIRHIYTYGTAILVGLWLLIGGIVMLSIWKP
ncbi:MAG: hypothetical protein RJS98_14800 [Rhodospirillaceae bacterium]